MMTTRTLYIVDTEEEVNSVFSPLNAYYIKSKGEIRVPNDVGNIEVFKSEKVIQETIQKEKENEEKTKELERYFKSTDFMLDKFSAMGVPIPDELK